MRKLPLLVCSLVLITGQLLAQTRVITGKITDANGSPVFSASVTVKGTKTGTSTAADGTFSLQVPSSAKTLVISAVSMTGQEVDITNTSTINVSLI